LIAEMRELCEACGPEVMRHLRGLDLAAFADATERIAAEVQ
jgi:hypothetical protein